MNIDDSVDWDVDRSVGAEFGRVNNGGAGRDFGAEFRRSDGKGVES